MTVYDLSNQSKPDNGGHNTRPIRHLPTSQALYDAWAPTYDNDGNMLQKMDDLELVDLLPQLLQSAVASYHSDQEEGGRKNNEMMDEQQNGRRGRPLYIMDLGCGTGRNLIKVIEYFENNNTRLGIGSAITAAVEMETVKIETPRVQLLAVDVSQGMLDVAYSKVAARRVGSADNGVSVEFIVMPTSAPQPVSETKSALLFTSRPELGGKESHIESFTESDKDENKDNEDTEHILHMWDGRLDAVISTLVLEHFSTAREFFRSVSRRLRFNGVTLVTNMHIDMGRKGGAAGFVMPAASMPMQWQDQNQNQSQAKPTKIRANSFLYSVEDSIQAAALEGLELEGPGVIERKVTEELLPFIGERGRKWVGTTVWYGMLLKKVRRE